MVPDQVKRKLAAILNADVKGYSRLMGEDEEWTLRTLKAYKEEMGRLIQQHRGRVVGTAGDSVLAEFASVVDAVQCAVEIQQVLRAKNAVLPETRRMEFRIGINLGDIIEEGDSIYGDGVNIAARLESLADPGGICISESAYQQIENKLPLKYEYLGEHQVKNIAKPVRVYKAQIETEVASREKMALPLPDLPSLAVLPFVNMSDDPKQEFFCDGMTEEIITALSKIPRLFVIARTSTFTYKGKPVKVKQISEELGVRYVLEGSLQRSGDRVRITAQLIDALTSDHIWAERYDRELKDIFALQDEITMKILNAMQVILTAGEGARLRGRGTKNLEAYLKVMQAREYRTGTRNRERMERARQLLEEAIALDPEYAAAYYGLAAFQLDLVSIGASESPRESFRRALELGEKALALDDSDPNFHVGLAFTYMFLREYDKGISEAEKAVSLSPNSATAYWALGWSLNVVGRPQEAIPLLQKSLRLSPIPVASNVLEALASSYIALGRYEDSIVTLKKELQLYGPDTLLAHLYLARAYGYMDREKEARAEGAEVLRIDPNFMVDRYLNGIPISDQSVKDHLANSLRKAGLK